MSKIVIKVAFEYGYEYVNKKCLLLEIKLMLTKIKYKQTFLFQMVAKATVIIKHFIKIELKLK